MNEKENWENVKKAMDTEVLELGVKTSYTVRHSLQGLLFILARYKFAVKMLQNRTDLQVLDLGCNDGFGDLMIKQNCACRQIVGVDFDEEAIRWARNNAEDTDISFVCEDFMGKDFTHIVCGGGYDCCLSLDVIEHISREKEGEYIRTISCNLNDGGFAIIGTPNITMLPYASPWNKLAHINNYNQRRLYNSLASYFRNVFIFGMNDEVLHTGMYPMSCYILALCCGKI